MYRNSIEKLKLWKEDIERKPLILKGARQVGKTYLLKEFAKNYYKNFVYINFDTEEQIKDIFKKSKDPQRIITELSLVKDLKIEPKHTLIIFDEVQECPEALNSLKYFYDTLSAGTYKLSRLIKHVFIIYSLPFFCPAAAVFFRFHGFY